MLHAELEVGSERSPVVDPMVNIPVEDVVVEIAAESCTVTETPARAVPEVFFTVPAALHPQDWPTVQPTRTAQAPTVRRIELSLAIGIIIVFRLWNWSTVGWRWEWRWEGTRGNAPWPIARRDPVVLRSYAGLAGPCAHPIRFALAKL
jgi:hypothetical protein